MLKLSGCRNLLCWQGRCCHSLPMPHPIDFFRSLTRCSSKDHSPWYQAQHQPVTFRKSNKFQKRDLVYQIKLTICPLKQTPLPTDHLPFPRVDLGWSHIALTAIFNWWNFINFGRIWCQRVTRLCRLLWGRRIFRIRIIMVRRSNNRNSTPSNHQANIKRHCVRVH